MRRRRRRRRRKRGGGGGGEGGGGGGRGGGWGGAGEAEEATQSCPSGLIRSDQARARDSASRVVYLRVDLPSSFSLQYQT